jgi:L-alanine-DL-glutamate epimerase-like enolase superfamily enzyme
MATRLEVPVERVDVSVYTIPTDEPESDGTFEWDSTTLVVVQLRAAGKTGLGYTYGPKALAVLVEDLLAPLLTGSDPVIFTGTDPVQAWTEMGAALRNAGRPGVGSMAIAAVDIALWDLRARLLDLSLVDALDAQHDVVPLYGSGGFTSYTNERLAEQLGGWVDEGFPRVKMKIGRDPGRDPSRLDAAREAIGDAELFVDANGAYKGRQAFEWADRLADWDVRWLEEPVSSDDPDGLSAVRKRTPIEVAAGEYIYLLADARAMLAVEAVDCLQADVTRCGGITGFLQVAALAEQAGLDVSAHCAPQVSAHACLAIPNLRHLEWFHDHVRVERTLFDGVLEPENGALRPDRSRPGHGLELKQVEAQRHAA